MSIEDLGEVRTWDEAIDRAQELREAGKVDAVATVSVKEFSQGSYVATPLRGMGFSEEEVLDNLRSLGPVLYPEHERLRLVLREVKTAHPAYPEKDALSYLLIVYVRPGESAGELTP